MLHNFFFEAHEKMFIMQSLAFTLIIPVSLLAPTPRLCQSALRDIELQPTLRQNPTFQYVDFVSRMLRLCNSSCGLSFGSSWLQTGC